MRISFYLGIFLVFFACGSGTMLDQPFQQQSYDEDLLFMLKKEQLNSEEVFELVYAIVRQREYYNYEIAGKTYGEILVMAQTFRQQGLPVEQVLNRNGEQELVTATIVNEGPAYIRKEGSKSRLEKKLKFSAEFNNRSNADVILSSTTFLMEGPFQDYLGQLAYSLNLFIGSWSAEEG